MISLQPARPDEAALLTELCVRSEGGVGVRRGFIAACHSELAMTPDTSPVAEIDDNVVGVAQLTFAARWPNWTSFLSGSAVCDPARDGSCLPGPKPRPLSPGAVVLIVDSDPMPRRSIGVVELSTWASFHRVPFPDGFFLD